MAVDDAVGIVIIEFVRIHFFLIVSSQWLQTLIAISNNTQRTMADVETILACTQEWRIFPE